MEVVAGRQSIRLAHNRSSKVVHYQDYRLMITYELLLPMPLLLLQQLPALPTSEANLLDRVTHGQVIGCDRRWRLIHSSPRIHVSVDVCVYLSLFVSVYIFVYPLYLSTSLYLYRKISYCQSWTPIFIQLSYYLSLEPPSLPYDLSLPQSWVLLSVP